MLRYLFPNSGFCEAEPEPASLKILSNTFLPQQSALMFVVHYNLYAMNRQKVDAKKKSCQSFYVQHKTAKKQTVQLSPIRDYSASSSGQVKTSPCDDAQQNTIIIFTKLYCLIQKKKIKTN